jgi:hypothetical protein
LIEERMAHDGNSARRATEASVCQSLEPRSNETLERDVHPKKQPNPIISTEEGIQIDESREHL